MRSVLVGAWLLVASVALSDTTLKVPDLTGKTLAEATAMLKAAGFLYEPQSAQLICGDKAPDVDDGQIQCQNPDPGALVGNNKLVEVGVRHGGHRKGVLIIDQLRPLVGHSLPYVKDALKKLGFDGTLEVVVAPEPVSGCMPEHVCEFVPNDNVDLHGRLKVITEPK